MVVTSKAVANACRKLSKGEAVRKRIAGLGRLHVDRKLPFLCVYRQQAYGEDPGTEKFVSTEASHFLASPDASDALLKHAIRSVVDTQLKEFGAFLLVELWASERVPADTDADQKLVRPSFRLYAPNEPEFRDTVEKLGVELRKIRLHRVAAEVKMKTKPVVRPPGMKPLLRPSEARELNCLVIGLEIEAIYRDPQRHTIYPFVLRSMRRSLSRALKKTFHHFLHRQTLHVAPSYHSLGRSALVKAVWDADRKLARISDSFDFLLQSTPLNVASAWKQFMASRYKKAPVFYYRPLPLDPALMKRELFKVPIERIEDPTLEHIFSEKLNELDQQLTMLMNIGTPVFFYGSMQLYGRINSAVTDAALMILKAIPASSGRSPLEGSIDARAFASLARKEIRRYRKLYPSFAAGVDVRDDLFSGMMASKGRLLVGKDTRVSAEYAGSLINHEVGTHLLTYYNGRAQPFQQLYTGLAGYDEMQEGLAVLAEYLGGALTGRRLRVLAARVVAARELVAGASFVEVFRLLNEEHGFQLKAAFHIAMRVFRGGGLTKDFVYLQGLMKILDFIRKGGDLEKLYIGKIATRHVPLIKELIWREVLRPMPLRPGYLDSEIGIKRLDELRRSESLLDVVVGHAAARRARR